MKQTAAPRRWASSPRARRFADRLLASDPGLQRLRSATRVTLATVAAALVSSPMIVADLSTVAPLFGAVVALMTPVFVRDTTLEGRKLTTLLLFFPAVASVALGGLLSSTLWGQAIALLIIVFFAFYIRRFGPRYVAAGLITAILFFVSSIVSSFLGFGAGDLPWITLAVAAGVACAYVLRFHLLPDNPRSVLRRSLAAFDVQLRLTLEAIAETVADHRSDERRDKRLRREADRLHERASATEGQLLPGETEISREDSDRLRLYLFDAEISANTLAEISWRYATSECDFPPEVRDPLLRTLEELCATLRRGTGPGKAPRALRELEHARSEAAPGDSDWTFQARRAEAAIRQLSEGAGEGYEQGPASAHTDDEETDKGEDQSSRREGIAGRLRPTTIQGIQAALACGLALAAGELLSPERSYWVVIIAFVVFAGSGTLGDTLARGIQRTVGTLGGAFVGFFLASAVSGRLYLEAPLIVACIFLAFYLFTVSQTLMMFWITVLLAVVFDIAGLLGEGILAVRFFDTLLGSVIGLAVAALVLPTGLSTELRQSTDDFLDALQDYVRDRVRQLAGGGPGRHPVEQAREVDEKLQTVIQNATTARRQAMVFGRPRTDLNRWMTGLLALNYYARHLSGPVGRRQNLEENSRQSEPLREIGDRISSNIDELREAISDGKEPAIRDIDDLMQGLESLGGDAEQGGVQDNAGDAPDTSPVPGQSGPSNALHYLRRINRTLGELAAAPTVGRRKSPGS